MVKGVYEVKKDGGRNIIKRCGECRKSGETKEFGKNWSIHWQLNHENMSPHGTYFMVKGKDQVEVDLKHLRRGTHFLPADAQETLSLQPQQR